jgi:dUTP pyrophosphatase
MLRKDIKEVHMTNEIKSKLTLLQDALNEYITKDWKQNRTELDFMVANHQEMAELIDTEEKEGDTKHAMNWKWWKGAAGERTMDIVNWNDLHPKVVANVKIELTDLLFFTLSQKVLNDHTDEDEYIEIAENDWLNFMSITANNLMQRPGASLMLIIQLAEKLGFNIAAYYIAKHTLNHIRQLTGYKDGSYVKVNDGVEDNELLHGIIKGITMEDLSKDFDGVAEKIMNDVYDTFSVGESDRMNITKWSDLVA